MLHEWQQHFAAALRQPTTPPADDTFIGHQNHRFAVYQHNMLGSLIEALGQTFPVTCELVGATFFDAVVADYVRREPPRAPRLSHYGATFPAALRALPQLRELGYVADVAELEWARVESYFSGVADQILATEMLLSQPSEALPHLVFLPVASLRIVSTATAASRIWLAHQSATPDLTALDPWQSETVRLLCHPAGVVMERLSASHAVFLQALQGGADLTAAAEMAIAADPGFDLQAALAAELAAGSFSGLAAAVA